MSNPSSKQTDILIALAREAELWHTSNRRAMATVEIAATHQNLEIGSREFREWLQLRFYRTQGTAASAHALKRAEEVLKAEAVFEGPENEAFIRVAPHEGNIYLDLGGPGWHVIEITPDGWRPVLDPPVRFYRSEGLGDLPWPQSGGSVEDLRTFMNVRTDGDFILAVAWLIAALSPNGPFPIALIQGEQGSAKSTLARIMRSLVDPSKPLLATSPRSERDLVISANNSWVLAFDNLSGIKPWLSDALCRMATGGGFRTRKLYSDTDEVILELCRPQILNGIEDLATRDDLRDRGILLDLPVIRGEQRQREQDLRREFRKAQPRILGALLDAVSTAMREEGSGDLPALPRMADFAARIVAAEKSLPWVQGAFLDAYEQNRRDAISLVLDHSPLAQRMIAFAELHGEWDGTATDLYDRLCLLKVPAVASPASAASMSQELRRIAPALRQVGVDVEFYRENDRKRTRKIAVHAVRAVRNDDAPESDESSGIPVELVGPHFVSTTGNPHPSKE